MADSTITNLPTLSTPQAADAFVTVQGGVDYQQSRQQFVDNIVINKSQVTALNTSLDSLNNDIDQVSGDLAIQATRIDNNQSSILTLGSDLVSANNSIAALSATVDTKAAKTTTITAGGLLTGGGDLSLNRTVSLPSTSVLQPSNNLSDVLNAATARTNLGLGTAATQNTSAFLLPSNNLSDVANTTTAMSNLGVTTALALKQDIATIPFRAQALTLSALKAISTTSLSDGTMILVKNVGVFKYNSTAVNTADDVIYVSPSSGTGRWVRVVNNLPVPSQRTISSGSSTTVVATDFASEITIFVSNGFTFNLTDDIGLYLTPGFYFDVIQMSTGAITFNPTGTAVVEGNPVIPAATGVGSFRKVRVSLLDSGIWFVDYQGTSIGKHDWPISLGSMYAAITNGATITQVESTTNKNNFRGFSFVQSGLNYLHFRLPMPKSWNKSTFTAKYYWKANATTGNVVWSIQAVIRNSGSAEDLAFGSAVSITSATGATAYIENISSETGAITPAGTAQNGCEIEFRISRNGGGGADTLAASAILTGFMLFITTNAANDA